MLACFGTDSFFLAWVELAGCCLAAGFAAVDDGLCWTGSARVAQEKKKEKKKKKKEGSFGEVMVIIILFFFFFFAVGIISFKYHAVTSSVVKVLRARYYDKLIVIATVSAITRRPEPANRRRLSGFPRYDTSPS